MKDADVLYLCEFCADHIEHFNAWPVEWENPTTGKVLDMATYTAFLENTVPSLYRLLAAELLD